MGIRAAVPWLVGSLLLSTGLAGCLGPLTPLAEPTRPGPLSSLWVYEYRYPGDDVFHPDHAYGWMARVTNVGLDEVFVGVHVASPANVTWGPVSEEGWQTGPSAPLAVPVAPGESVLFLFQATVGSATEELRYAVQVMEEEQADETGSHDPVLEESSFVRSLRQVESHVPVVAGDHVQTATVGVWTNGTSFYTNIASLNGNMSFPAGYDRANFGGDPLPVYVYDEEGSEQPPGSRDACRFVTIQGYNALLKTQAEGTTGVRFLAPEEAYTRPGNDAHFLYGDALIFLNTIVAHDGTVDIPASLPDPTAPCFDAQNTVDWVPLPI